MSESPSNSAEMEAYRNEKADSCISDAQATANLISEKIAPYDRASSAFYDAYQILNNVPRNDADGLLAINIIDSYERGTDENGRRIVESLRGSDTVIRVAGHIEGLRHAAEGDPREYFRLALNAAQTQYELMRQGKESGDAEHLMDKIAKLSAAVTQLEKE